MSSRRYPLTALLEQRRALREQARRALAEALGRLTEREREHSAAEAARAALASERDGLAAHLYDPDAAGLLQVALVERRAAELQNVEERGRQAERTAEAARAAVAAAEAEHAVSRQALVEADRELKSAEKHHEAWRAEERKQSARKDERQGEEVSLARFVAEAGTDEGADQGRAR